VPDVAAVRIRGHRIEGIGDKHVPWVHNVRNTDVVVVVDDEQCLALMRLFNEEAGQAFLSDEGVSTELIEHLPDLGISSICNVISDVKTARYLEFDRRDVIFCPLTDSMDLYASRLDEQREVHGPYTRDDATRHMARYLEGISTDHMRDLNYSDRKALHNFKYFTWVEQQGKSADELRELWDPDFWSEVFSQAGEWDQRIEAFNRETGLLDRLDED